MKSDKLLALWINRLIVDHFKAQKKDFTEKLFIKITGLTNNNIEELLIQTRKNMTTFKEYYDPIIRTVKNIEGFEEFSFRDYETSTWLRNNTKYNQAFILIINDLTPEGQSLENLFTIDESSLLTGLGLSSLYNVLSESSKVAADEIEHIETFMEMYKSISEPQLMSILNFITHILNDQGPSVVEKIQKNLPYLNLFSDSKLKINILESSRLKRNYLLANLQIKDSDQEKIQNNLYSFIDKEELNQWPDEIWQTKSVDELTNEIIGFLNQNSTSFLFNDFDFVQKITEFKNGPSTIKSEIEEVYINNQSTFDENGKREFEEGLNEVVCGNNPEAIQDFVEEFEDLLNQKKGLVKKLNRLIEKLRNPSIYEDINHALMREVFSLIEEESNNSKISDSTFELEIVTPKSPENVVSILKVYLTNIKSVIPRINFIIDSLPEVDNSVKDTDVNFKLTHKIEDADVSNKKFKVTTFNNLNLYSFSQLVKDNKVPYLVNYAENEIELIDIMTNVQDRVKHYLSSGTPNIKENLDKFKLFLEQYTEILHSIFENGVFSIDYKSLEIILEKILENLYSSSIVSQQILQCINLIGATDFYDNKKGESGIPVSRILTILNPIRLLAYIKRYEEISLIIDEWLINASKNILEVEKLDEYLEFMLGKSKHLAPRYFSSYGDESFLIEKSEVLGEGSFILNTKPANNTDYISNELSEELVKTTKNYLEVYPYAKDGMDILLLHCHSSDVIIKCVDSLFSKTKIKKLRLTVHSESAAKLHNQLNKWLQQKEEYTKPDIGSKFPKLEIGVISGRSASEIFTQIDKKMSDSDLVILADYFGQSNQIRYNFERIKPKLSLNWFETLYKEPLKDDEAVKRISYVSEHLPKVLQLYYQMQYIVQTNAMPDKDEINVLKNIISITNINHSSLIDFMHRKFNWVMILDRYLDKTLLTKTSSEANIIQYKPKAAGQNSEFKLIVSSSKYIKKISEKTSDFAYYDRLHRKLVSILKNENISRDIVIDSVNKVKDISGSLVLKVIGRGKYAHEMLATYLSTIKRSNQSVDKLQIWSICDDLPWFANNKRRPDLVLTTICKEQNNIKINFELIELKFINHNIFDKERFDALKQVKSGLNLYNKLFSLSKTQLDTNYWRSELVQYLVERSAYPPNHVHLIKDLQHTDLENIEVTISGSVDAYCYTSNLTNYNFEKVDDGIFKEELEPSINNYMYARSYILKELQTDEAVIPNYEDVDTLYSLQESLKQSIGTISRNDETETEEVDKAVDFSNEQKISTDDFSEINNIEDSKNIGDFDNVVSKSNEENIGELYTLEENNMDFPEAIALAGLSFNYEDIQGNSEELKDMYIRKLKYSFNQNGIHISIKDSIIGSSVIRLIISLPHDLSANKILSKTKDIQLWLGLNSEPHIFINKQGMNIDIIRETPETIYFEKFMQLTRNQIQNEVSNVNLIAPLGLDPLNNVIYMDFSSSMSPHLLTGGTTGSGKSVTLNSIILGMMCLYSPEQLQFIFIDPKKVEFTIYQEKKHTMNVITELNESVNILNELVNEMESRYTKFAKEGVTNLEEYITEVKIQLPRLVLVFDEFADFMTQDGDMKKQVENSILRLGQKARAAGIHLIICTQNPRADIINTNIRNNLGARLALRAADANASNIILDESGAENLAGKGDFLAKIHGNIDRGKSPFLTTQVRRALLNYFKKVEQHSHQN
ncbi:FtsK/SpoIIIE domain-containing protein [Metabacillus dongyingensis]|uniref:FtsK/SpoIIIE domain-containing protein n=1 Tax=Metabacillus dongyingensis TaxID=2874282 RepID=UPI001CC058C4|nr:FtsK/SpoIIIE domain-containing protein [Metabacillus dongyingensis]UAL53607.1 DNA translocase FtsK [Metabacillus dongyingensis]